MPVFEESQKISDITVTVKAEEGVFPEGARISVRELSEEEQKKADAAIEAERPENTNVAKAYSYDIKVLDPDGNDLQPAGEKSVEISFRKSVTCFVTRPFLTRSRTSSSVISRTISCPFIQSYGSERT